MSTYSISDLLSLWRRGELTAEQAIGHLLQHIDALTTQTADHEKRLRRCEARATSQPEGKG